METLNSTVMVNDSDVQDVTLDPGQDQPPVQTLEDIMNEFWEYRVSNILGIYIFPIIVGLGTIGNLLSFLVFIRKSMRSSSTCFYMMVMAVADTLVLYFNALRKWLSFLNGYDAVTESEIGCKIFTFLSYFSFAWSAWLLVAMTIERFIAIHFPLKAPRIATPGKAKKVIFALFLILFAWNCHFLWTVTMDDSNQCIPGEDYKKFHDYYVPWMDAFVYSFIPFAVLITFNILIIRDTSIAMRNRRTLRGRNPLRDAQTDSRAQFHQRLTIILLSVSFTFLVCSCPKVVLIAIRDTQFQFYFDNGIPNFHEIAKYVFVSRLSDLFLYINHSFNFVLYSIHGKKFRKEMKNLFLCRNHDIRRRSTISMSLDVTGHRVSNETALSTVASVMENQPSDMRDQNGTGNGQIPHGDGIQATSNGLRNGFLDMTNNYV
ncbi:hypothetical protein FSP39_015603 [Pinctada imbricata]|uniref:G-protein coupled receptors family 1 profile domain-containing protein n=1 Tax=Pinctada imbricata TaxID=66713 RepID=A0AA88Y5J8_PINIB|nr:hypothetical protein FSP39_015603 [Pinctada imbricata]